jgi:hypothetical protein
MPSVMSKDQTEVLLGKLEPMIKRGIENMQKLKQENILVPEIKLWEKYRLES